GDKDGAASSSCRAGRSVWERGADRGRADPAGRGAGSRRQNGGSFLRGGAVSAERRANTRSVWCPKSRVWSPRRGKGMFSEGHRDCSAPAGEVVRAASGDEPKPTVAAARQAGQGPPAAGRDLRLVHRRL